MVVDTSAITAILANEADAEALEKRLLADPVRLISAATFLDLTIVIEGKFGEAGAHEFNTWFELAASISCPWTMLWRMSRATHGAGSARGAMPQR